MDTVLILVAFMLVGSAIWGWRGTRRPNLGPDLHNPPQLARLVVGELPGPSVKFCLRHRSSTAPTGPNGTWLSAQVYRHACDRPLGSLCPVG